MSYKCPTCGQMASCWSPNIYNIPAPVQSAGEAIPEELFDSYAVWDKLRDRMPSRDVAEVLDVVVKMIRHRKAYPAAPTCPPEVKP